MKKLKRVLCIIVSVECILVVILWHNRTGLVRKWPWSSDVICLDEDGSQLYGEQEIDGEWYYFDEETGIMQTGFVLLDGVTYYYNADGTRAGGALEIDGSWYYFDEDTGAMHTGFLELADGTCYYDEDGTRAAGLRAIDGALYYFDETLGTMITDQYLDITIDGVTQLVYFSDDGSMDAENVGSGTVDEDGNYVTTYAEMEAGIETIMDSYGGTCGVYFEYLPTGDFLTIEDENMYPCSLIKVFVMAAVYEEIAEGSLDYDDRLYYLENMMIYSDNTCYNTLLAMLGNGSGLDGAAVVNEYCASLGILSTAIHHGLTPGTGYFTDGGENTTCPSDVAKLLEYIYDGEIVSESACAEMIEIMSQCYESSGLPAGLPAGITCAHKSGWAYDYYLDGGIVYAPAGDFILVVFTDQTGSALVADIAEYVYDYLNEA